MEHLQDSIQNQNQEPSQPTPRENRQLPLVARVFFGILTIALIASVLYLIRGIIHPIFLGIFFGTVLAPLHQKIWRGYAENRLSFKAKVAACISVVIFFLIITIPVSLTITKLGLEGRHQLTKLNTWLKKDNLPQEIQKLRIKTGYQTFKPSTIIWDFLDKQAQRIQVNENAIDSTPTLAPLTDEHQEATADSQNSSDVKIETAQKSEQQKNQNIADMFQKVGRWATSRLVNSLGRILSGTAISIFHYFIMLFVMFFILLDGNIFRSYFVKSLPLPPPVKQRIMERIKVTLKAVLLGILAMAVIQGIPAALFFLCIGIPWFYGLLLGACSLVPIVGTGLVWIPATLYLLAVGKIWSALLCLLIVGGFIGNVDTFLRAKLIKQSGKTGLSYFFLFFSLMGGLQTFGIIGLIYGPLIMALCALCLTIYQEQKKYLLEEPDFLEAEEQEEEQELPAPPEDSTPAASPEQK